VNFVFCRGGVTGSACAALCVQENECTENWRFCVARAGFSGASGFPNHHPAKATIFPNGVGQAVRKRLFCGQFMLNPEYLPRQAQNKYSKKLKMIYVSAGFFRPRARGAENAFLSHTLDHLLGKNDQFTKTGSGQT
jgi:hypothetical protein